MWGNRIGVGKIETRKENLMTESKENPRGLPAKQNKEMGAVAGGGSNLSKCFKWKKERLVGMTEKKT